MTDRHTPDLVPELLVRLGVGRNWITGPLEPPLGRGINLQITVPDADSVAAALGTSGHELFLPPETRHYRVGDREAGVRQFLVTDPGRLPDPVSVDGQSGPPAGW